jgi:hypothetical protein
MRVKMSKFFWNSLCIGPAVLGAALVVSSSALAADNQPTSETLGTQAAQAKTAVNQSDAVVSTTATSLKPFEASPKQAQLILPKSPAVVAQAAPAGQDPSTLQQLNEYSSEGAANAEGQVTSVSQLSDVQPTDWAFQALQSLVERYGCIAGYPDGTFKGNRAMTRYEFAAGLNACLDKVSELIASSTANLVTREDLAAVQRLQEEFAAELAALRGRVDALEARTSELEANQFSTTTKLTGEAIFGLAADLSNGKIGAVSFKKSNSNLKQNQAVFQDRVRLNLNTSFTGQDLLVTRLQAGNGTRFNYGNTGSGTLNWQNVTPDNTFRLDTLEYKFPLGDRLNVTLAANAGTWDDIMPTVNPYFDDSDGGNGALSLFGQRNPIYRLGGGAGAGINYSFGGKGLLGGIFGPTSFSLGYLAATAANPTQGNGFFNGDQSTMAQLTFTPASSFQFALAYNHSYFGRGNWGYDNGAASGATLSGYTGTGFVNGLGDPDFLTPSSKPNGRKVVSDSYAFNMSWRVTPGFVFGGWGTYGKARIIGFTDAKLWTYAATFAFPDLGKPGNLLGFVVGREPYLQSVTANSVSLGTANKATSWHLEGFYKLQLTDNISITPGVVWITRPNQTKGDGDIITGTIRTTFTF